MYVFPDLAWGNGNRLFQVAAALGYSEKYGHTIVFVKSCIKDNYEHPGSEDILKFFPNIPVIDDIKEFKPLKQGGKTISSYEELPYCQENVKLIGLFQSDKYFPSYRIRPALIGYHDQPFQETIFLHVRRGDYLKNPVNNVDLTQYYKNALTFVKPEIGILVCSDDIPWCKENLPKFGLYKWIWFEGNDVETWRAMSKCRYGGICANSTFSWWGAYFNHSADKKVYFPAKWYNTTEGQITDDVYQKNSIKVEV
jgi:hypothetical protein